MMLKVIWFYFNFQHNCQANAVVCALAWGNSPVHQSTLGTGWAGLCNKIGSFLWHYMYYVGCLDFTTSHLSH